MLEWGTLIVCGVALLVRTPDAVRGRNREVYGILFLATLCSALSIPGPYAAVDALLGGWNLTNLALRFIVFGMVFLVGVRLAKGLGATRARGLITGKGGRRVLAAACLALAVTFLMLDTGGSSAGLQALSDDSPRNAALVPLYAAVGRVYPAYVSLMLLPALLSAVRARLPRLVRAGAVLTGGGAAAAIATVPVSFAPDAWDTARQIVNYSAVLGYVLGLLLFWLSSRFSRPPDNARATFGKK
jgi:hypothetical protein